MFNLSPEKLILICVLALIVLGPNKLPDAARSMGRVVGELRRMSSGLKDEMRGVLDDPRDSLSAAVADLRQELGGLRQEVGGFGLSGGVGTSAGSTPAGSVPSAPGPTVPQQPDDPSLN